MNPNYEGLDRARHDARPASARWRHLHVFKARSGHWGVSGFFPTEDEAIAWAAVARDAMRRWAGEVCR
jgi:hypothetical protein